jgi:hypothetical protein
VIFPAPAYGSFSFPASSLNSISLNRSKTFLILQYLKILLLLEIFSFSFFSFKNFFSSCDFLLISFSCITNVSVFLQLLHCTLLYFSFSFFQEMECNFVTNVHELAFCYFLANDCPTSEVRILTKFYKASMVVFRAGNVSYNAIMIAKTIISDFFVKKDMMDSGICSIA